MKFTAITIVVLCASAALAQNPENGMDHDTNVAENHESNMEVGVKAEKSRGVPSKPYYPGLRPEEFDWESDEQEYIYPVIPGHPIFGNHKKHPSRHPKPAYGQHTPSKPDYGYNPHHQQNQHQNQHHNHHQNHHQSQNHNQGHYESNYPSRPHYPSKPSNYYPSHSSHRPSRPHYNRPSYDDYYQYSSHRNDYDRYDSNNYGPSYDRDDYDNDYDNYNSDYGYYSSGNRAYSGRNVPSRWRFHMPRIFGELPL